MKAKLSNHLKLSTKIASMSDTEVRSLLDKSEVSRGWGGNHIVNILNKKIFVKTIPVTDIEINNSFDTKNLYNLPLYYNYGVGSAGLGAFRELVLHIKTTNWVLAGEIDEFPLMHHYRVLKKKSKPKEMNESQLKKHNEYIDYWNGSKRIDSYIKKRKVAEHEIVIFLEYIPYVLKDWLKSNTHRVNEVKTKVFRVFDFLKSKGILHFDAHYNNILTNGEKFYLIDFGLGIDKKFNLSKKEKQFLSKHKNYDYMEFLGCSAGVLESKWHDLSKRNKNFLMNNYDLCEDTPFYEKTRILLENLNEVKNIMKLDDSYVRFLRKHQELIFLSNNFFYNMRQDKKTDYPAAKIDRALKDCGVI